MMAPLPATEGTSMAVTRATDPGKAKDVSRLRYVPNMRNKRAEGGYIANVTACLANVLHTQFSCWISDNWCQRRYLSIWPYTCSRPHRPSISAWYELADGDLSQNVPVKRNPVLLQNMIHPTPHKSAALFLSYEPSVTHVSVFDFMPSTIHERFCLYCWLSSMLSHIHVSPHVSRNSQKSVGRSRPLANGTPSFSLFTFVFV